MMLSIHCILGLPLLLLPLIFPSSSVQWMLFSRTRWPKNFSFLFLIIFINSLLVLALLITSVFVVLSVHAFLYLSCLRYSLLVVFGGCCSVAPDLVTSVFVVLSAHGIFNMPRCSHISTASIRCPVYQIYSRLLLLLYNY